MFRAIITPEVSLRKYLACGEVFTVRHRGSTPRCPAIRILRPMKRGEIIEKTNTQFSHRHWCEVEGHYYECGEDCVCICGLPMSGNDHSDCPVELKPCPDHKEEQKQSMSEEALPEGLVEIMFPSDWQHAALPHCDCGCSEIDLS